MTRTEVFQKVADAITEAEKIAPQGLQHEVILNWLNIANHWLALSHNLPDPAPADVKTEGTEDD